MPSKQKIFEVEKVIGKRTVRGSDYYLLKWKDSWEPIHTLECKQLIANFEKRRKLSIKRGQSSSTGRSGSASSSKAVKTTNRKRGRPATAKATKPQKRGRPAKAKATEPLLEKPKSEPSIGSERGLNPDRIIGTTEADLPVPVKTDNVLFPDIEKPSISVSVDENVAKATESKDLPNV